MEFRFKIAGLITVILASALIALGILSIGSENSTTLNSVIYILVGFFPLAITILRSRVKKVPMKVHEN